MNEYQFSVLVLQYNPKYDLMKRTIMSILQQKDINFEIVIADDGSKEDFFEKLEAFFEENAFSNYVLVKNVQNQGTVKNVLSGLKKCSGKYVKCISPGDYLYNEQVLLKTYKKMEETQAGLLFGEMVFYSRDNDEIKIYNERRPYQVDIYRENDSLKIRKHLLIYQDNISGASAFVRRDLLVNVMKKIENDVIYQEDVAFSMLTFMNEKLVCFDEYVVWYEYGGGISTSAVNKWTKILQNDTLRYYYILERLYHKQKYVSRALLFQRLEMKEGRIWKIVKTLLYPDRYVFRRKNISSGVVVKETPELLYLERILR